MTGRTVWTRNPSTGRLTVGIEAADETIIALFDAVFDPSNTCGDDDSFMAIEVLFDGLHTSWDLDARQKSAPTVRNHLVRWQALAEMFDLEVWWSFDVSRPLALVTIIDPERVAD